MTPSAALLVVNYGSRELIEENLTRTIIPDGTSVVIVDNPTTDRERAALAALCAGSGWTLLSPQSNLGFGGGMNLAAAEAISQGAEVLVLLNPDAYLVGDGLERLIKAAADPNILIAPLVERPDGGHFSSEMEIDLADGSLRRRIGGRVYDESAMWVSGACFAIGADLWGRIGGFDDDYFLYWEDVDLSVRATRSGATIAVDQRIVAVHSPGGTQGGGRGKSAIYYRFNTRNRLVFAAKNVPRSAHRRWLWAAPKAAKEIVLRGGRRQLLHPSQTLWPAVRGTWEGWRFLRHATGRKVVTHD